ncbi:MAG: hypothetical protein ABJA89_13700 [Lapillicoccus sp.]
MTPDVEDLLRARLHEVDDLQPPDGFELQALRAARDRLKRRQAWTRGLVGAAAAVAVGALAIPAVGRLGANGGTASSGSAASKVSAPQAPQGAEGAAPSGPADASTGAVTYTAAQCQSTLARVAADRDTLTRQGYAMGSLTCDGDGRVVLPITNLVTAEQLQVLKVRYGDPVKVVQAAGVPTTP